MAMFFEENIGNIMDIFHSLYILANEEIYIDKLNEDNNPISLGLVKYIDYAKKKCSQDMDSIRFFFKEYFDKRQSFTLYYLFLDKVFHEQEGTIEEVLNKLSASQEELLSVIGEKLMEYIKRDGGDVQLDNKAIDKEALMNLLVEYNLPSEAKWNIYLMINNPCLYAERLLTTIKNYLSVYEKFNNRIRVKKSKFNDTVRNDIEKHGINYIKDMELFEEVEEYSNIYISTLSVFYGNVVYDIRNNNLYLYLGIKYKEALDSYRGKNKKDYTINIMKAMGDGSRYEILSLLDERDRYGQELAEAMSLSTATISHHMNFLHTLGLVTVEKMDNRMYYKLRREALKKFIKDFSEDFKL